MKNPPADSIPQQFQLPRGIQTFPAEAPAVTEQTQAIRTVPFPNSQLPEAMSLINQALFYPTKFWGDLLHNR